MRKTLVAIILILSFHFTYAYSVKIESERLAIPRPNQLEFLELELGVFIHYSIDPYSYIPAGKTPASAFNPTDLDVDQWIVAAKSMGATYVVLTARHEQGFCLWPTKTTEYSIKNSPYKSGKGDIVRDFVNACHRHGLKPGLYTAPWIDTHWDIDNNIKLKDSGDIHKLDDIRYYKKALEKEKAQIKELLTNYGELLFIWDDHFGRSDALEEKAQGGKLREFYAELSEYAHHLQPQCLLLGRDVEHVGNEDGRASYPLWNSLNTIDGTLYTVSNTYKWHQNNTGTPFGKFFRPQIACSTVAFTSGGWMWSEPRTAQPLDRVMQAYYETIGRGSNLIINFAPDRRGLIEDATIAAAKNFGEEIKRRFGTPITSSESRDADQIINFQKEETFNHIILMEDLANGQNIAEYNIDAQINGKWERIVSGKTIGHKRIDKFDTVKATAIKFTVKNSLTQKPIMRRIAVYKTAESI